MSYNISNKRGNMSQKLNAKELEIYEYSKEVKSIRKIADRFKLNKEEAREVLRKIKKINEENNA